jgi:hypothetical protein
MTPTPRTREHREDSKVCHWFLAGCQKSTTDCNCRDDMNFFAVHVICNDAIFHPNPNKEKQILFWVNHWVITKFNVSLCKHLQNADNMLQCPFISTIVFKDPNWKFGYIATTNSTYTQVTLSLMDGGWRTTWPRNLPPCLFLHIHSKYLRVNPWVWSGHQH